MPEEPLPAGFFKQADLRARRGAALRLGGQKQPNPAGPYVFAKPGIIKMAQSRDLFPNVLQGLWQMLRSSLTPHIL